jgi:PAS domain S-box-containing protein
MASDYETRSTLLASIIDSSDDAVISQTLDGTVTSWNRAAQAIYGYGASVLSACGTSSRT